MSDFSRGILISVKMLFGLGTFEMKFVGLSDSPLINKDRLFAVADRRLLKIRNRIHSNISKKNLR